VDWHPTEDDLIQHFYGDGAAQDEARIDAHLNTCASCQTSWIDVRETMQMIDVARVPEPPNGYERVLWAQIQPALAAATPRRASWLAWPRVLAPAGALAAVLLVGVTTWQMVQPAASRVDPKTTVTTAAAPLDAKAATRQRERVLLAALNGHFDDAQLVLTELMNTPETNASDFTFAHDVASDLVASGRLYRATAVQNGNTRLAAMLDDLESVLVDVAKTDKMNQADLQSLRTRITNSNLLFKVQALANDVRERQKTLATE